MAENFVYRSKMAVQLPGLDEPCVFRGVAREWGPAKFTWDDWDRFFSPDALKFRVGARPEFTRNINPELEPDAVYARMTFRQFRAFIAGRAPCLGNSSEDDEEGSRLESVDLNFKRNWTYFDYKHLPDVFNGDKAPELNQSVSWDFLGHPSRGAEQSTLWVGTKGAHTAGHFDTYGYNLVAQLQGRKLWVLFSPKEGLDYLKPSRVPFEESSVYSRLKISPMQGCDLDTLLKHHPDYKRMVVDNIEPRVIIVNPGDVLYVPAKWWHFVSSVSDEPTVSLNTWVELDSDNEARLAESATRLLVYALSQKHFLGTGSDQQSSGLDAVGDVLFHHETPLTEVDFKESLSILTASKERAKARQNPPDEIQAFPEEMQTDGDHENDVEKIFYQSVEASGGWERLVEILSTAFPTAEDGPPLLTAADVEEFHASREADPFTSFLRAVTHPKTVEALVDALINDP